MSKKSDYKNTQPYRLGLIYRELADLLMDHKTDIRDLAEFGHKHGFDAAISIIPQRDSALNGDAAEQNT